MIERQANRRHAVVAVIQKLDTFLFVQRSAYVEAASGYWCPVSGRIEKGETQEAALCREVREEVGLEVTAVKKVAETLSHDEQFVLHFWTTDIIAGEAGTGSHSHEVAAIAWVTLAELRQLQPTFEEDVKVFEGLFAL